MKVAGRFSPALPTRSGCRLRLVRRTTSRARRTVSLCGSVHTKDHRAVSGIVHLRTRRRTPCNCFPVSLRDFLLGRATAHCRAQGAAYGTGPEALASPQAKGTLTWGFEMKEVGAKID